ncbi:M23 family metallopeptidase [Aquihabitans sp. G128]|uniref:M23 family metallopeptidase n=1 Tax=Aquihabitans sp. G128 TaxID=2849779 RepID=UPI001C21D82B|nr:M23 family metallopeptidase [Aquihabitans sp. G128]QXC59805.1 M23 family metallopeptidase [Aquihabitans sp. G128]
MSCACHPDPADRGPAEAAGVSRRAVIAGGLAAGLVPALGWAGTAGAAPRGADDGTGTAEGTGPGPTTNDFGFLPPRPATEVHQQNIMFPVLPDATLGKATWTDTYLAPRSNGRKHEGQDLMGKKLLKLLACVDGTVVELRYETGGNSLYIKGVDGYYYCYLHINNDTPGTDDGKNPAAYAFAPGLAIGSVVKRGQHVAFLGDSGNAEATGSHCHFEIRLPNAKWYNAAACNAKYSLQAAEPAKLRAPVGPEAFAPAAGAKPFAQRQADDFLGAVPSQAWLTSAISNLEGGTISPDAFIESQLATGRVQAFTNPVMRLYLAAFGGIPAYDGVLYWVRQCRAGLTLDKAATGIVDSAKFTTLWGTLSNREFARRIELNLKGVEPTAATLANLTAKLDGGMTRPALARERCEDSTYRPTIANKIRVLTIYHAMLHRAPEANWWTTWSDRDRTSATGLGDLIRSIRTGGEYAKRFPAK